MEEKKKAVLIALINFKFEEAGMPVTFIEEFEYYYGYTCFKYWFEATGDTFILGLVDGYIYCPLLKGINILVKHIDNDRLNDQNLIGNIVAHLVADMKTGDLDTLLSRKNLT